MNDLELRLIHCEKEPSEVALYDAADAFLAVGDEEMFHGLKYMGEHKKMPWHGGLSNKYHWASDSFTISQAIGRPVFSDILHGQFLLGDGPLKVNNTFPDAVRWLGKRLIELGMVSS